jgi:hypothetical protein
MGATPLTDLVHAEAMLAAAEARTLDPHADPAEAQRRVAYWRERVRLLRERAASAPHPPDAPPAR